MTAYLSPKLAVKAHPEAGGYGIFARVPVESGELLVVWSGRVVTPEQLAQFSPEMLRRSVQVEEGLYLTSIYPDEPADYINHSCNPNAGMSGQIAVVAMRNIAPGEEITIDYAMCDGTPYDEFDCQCGAPNCRRRVTGDDWSRPELWERYAGFFSLYLQRRIERLKKASIRKIS